MRRTHASVVTVSLLLVCYFSVSVATAVTVGVQSGDWIEYNITSSGAPMQGHDVEWARMEITGTQNPNINVTITSRFTDQSNDTITSVLNLETGHLIDDFIIPANLNVGDTFRDENYGNVTIAGLETRMYAGAQRTILTAAMGNNTYYWDQVTGVSVEGSTQTADYAIHSVVSATNMWEATPIQGFDFASLILVTAVLLIIIIAFVVAIARYSKRKLTSNSSAN
jgi:hypothetical protein